VFDAQAHLSEPKIKEQLRIFLEEFVAFTRSTRQLKPE
jgi:hypothetical protein